MKTGEGLFWGLALLALVILYAQTKDRWQWKKSVLTLVGVAGLTIIVLLSAIWWDSRPAFVEPIPEPTRINSYWGITVGQATKSDVKFLKGAPFEEGTNDYGIDYFNYRRLDKHGDPIGSTHTVKFLRDQVCSVNYLNDTNLIDAGVRLFGIGTLSGIESLNEVMGEPEGISEYAGGLRREYEYYDAFNVAFMLERGQVIGWAVGGCNYKE